MGINGVQGCRNWSNIRKSLKPFAFKIRQPNNYTPNAKTTEYHKILGHLLEHLMAEKLNIELQMRFRNSFEYFKNKR